MPQPLSDFKNPGLIHVGNMVGEHVLDRSPALGAKAMKVIVDWGALESQLNALFVLMLGTNPRPAASIFAALTGTAAKTATVRAIAETALKPEPLDVFTVLMSLYTSRSKERNRIAHWTWGFAQNIADAFLLFDPSDMLRYQAEVRSRAETPWIIHGATTMTPMPAMPDFPDAMVYRAKDFDSIASGLRRVAELVHTFNLSHQKVVDDHLPSAHQNPNARLWPQLLAEPEIHEGLARLRGNRKTDLEAQRPPPSESEAPKI